MTLLAVRAWARLTQCRATAIGSLSAATSKGRSSGKTATLVPATAFWMSRYSLMPPSGPPQPIMPDRAACGLTTTRSPVFRPVLDLGAYLDDFAGRLVPERDGCGLPFPAQRHASHLHEGRVGAADAAGAYPHQQVARPGSRALDLCYLDRARRGGPRTDFIVGMGSLPSWFWWLACASGPQSLSKPASC